MAYKDILVYADAAPAAAARLDAAVLLAKAQDAHLVALHVGIPPFIPVDLLGTGVSVDLIEWQMQQRQAQADAARNVVLAAEQRHGLSIEWRKLDGVIDDALVDQSRYADLIVLSQDTPLTDLDAPAGPAAGSIVMAAGRPVLIVPKDYKGAAIGRHVLVAWKPSAEATRAVHDALPLLQRAKAVTVMRANPDPEEPAHNPGFDLATHLARHGVKVTVMPVLTPDISAGAAILDQARAMQADLIVMGAYGHSRLRELVFGGATHSLLQAPPVPVLMSR
ncbi:universal stress protein [Ferrovibrio terrae]|uniref:Universal stress protein n=1 Tax=Ferrovibrio terrae TaxID=2594003 RepID=A0A516H063_9PROT|nr:universal stress protein [Ferrovibrio terrae]QDO97142.1 universal stress protein [Ferrovibrio terrae]